MIQSTEALVLTRVREFIQENFLYMRPELVLTDDDQLLARGVIDSMGVLEVLSFLETEFGVTADDSEITEANFGSLGAIARFATLARR